MSGVVRRTHRTGDVVSRPTEAQRFWAKVDTSSDCWLWTGSDNGLGYGQFYLTGGKKTYAHRYGYQLLVGDVPAGTELDHLCETPRCVNPAHLEPVTHRTNMLRGSRNVFARHYRGEDCGGANCRSCPRFRIEDLDKLLAPPAKTEGAA